LCTATVTTALEHGLGRTGLNMCTCGFSHFFCRLSPTHLAPSAAEALGHGSAADALGHTQTAVQLSIAAQELDVAMLAEANFELLADAARERAALQYTSPGQQKGLKKASAKFRGKEHLLYQHLAKMYGEALQFQPGDFEQGAAMQMRTFECSRGVRKFAGCAFTTVPVPFRGGRDGGEL
jgi:hypothetical protein